MGKETVPVKDVVEFDPIQQKDVTVTKIEQPVLTQKLVDKVLELNDKYDFAEGQAVEVDIYLNRLDTSKSELLLVGDPLTVDTDLTLLQEDGKEYQRIGTIGNVDIEHQYKDLVRIVDKDLGVYEMNDGQGLKMHSELYAGLNKKLMKRTFIDSSFGNRDDLRAFLIELATEQNWYSRMEGTVNTAIKEEKPIEIEPLDDKPK